MADLNSSCAGECDVLAPPGGLKAIDHIPQGGEIFPVEPLGRSQGKVEAVGNDREMRGQNIKLGQAFARVVEIVVRDDLEKVDALAVKEQISQVRRSEANSYTQAFESMAHG